MPSLRHFLLVAALVFAAWPAAAQDSFAIQGIEVDVSAETVAKAKEQALAEAQARALRQVLERMTQPADHIRLPHPDPAPFVRDIGIEQERASSVRYIALVSVRFNPAAIRRLLTDSGIAFTEMAPRRVLVVPVFRPAAGPILMWEEANPWRAAWAASGRASALAPGDAADMRTLTAEQALAAAPERLAALAARHGASDVLVLLAGLAPGGRQLDITALGTPEAPRPFEQRTFSANEGENDQALMRRAAREISRGLDGPAKAPVAARAGQNGTMPAIVPLGGFEDWLAVRERLARAGAVRRTELVSLSRGEAAMILYIAGSEDQAKASLAHAGLALEWTDGYWTMRLRR